jgi:FkbM family methyltransferase
MVNNYLQDLGFRRFLKRFFEKIIVSKIGNFWYFKVISKKPTFNVKLKTGLVMALPSVDQGLSKCLFIHKIREEEALNFYLKNLKKIDSVIDCGSNLGYFAVHAAQKANFVYAIEPLKMGVHFTGINFFLNDLKNFRTFNFAIGKKSEKETDFIKSNSFNTSRVSTKQDYKIKNLNITKIPIKTIDDFTRVNNIKANVLRMDVEGHELEILKGAKNFLKQKDVLLFIEVHPYQLKKEGVQEFFEIMRENNFKKIFIDNFNKKFKKNFYFEKINLDSALLKLKKSSPKKGIVFRMFFKKS